MEILSTGSRDGLMSRVESRHDAGVAFGIARFHPKIWRATRGESARGGAAKVIEDLEDKRRETDSFPSLFF